MRNDTRWLFLLLLVMSSQDVRWTRSVESAVSRTLRGNKPSAARHAAEAGEDRSKGENVDTAGPRFAGPKGAAAWARGKDLRIGCFPQGLRGGAAESSAPEPSESGTLPALTLDRVAEYVMGQDLGPEEPSDTDPSVEMVPVPPPPETDDDSQDDSTQTFFVPGVQLRPPPRSERAISWQETKDLSVYEVMLKESPRNADIWSAYGHALMVGHNAPERAMQAYGRAIELVPSHAYALNNLGYILMKHRGDIAMAEGCLRKALATAPSDVSTLVNLAVLLSAHRHPPDNTAAADLYERALAIDASHLYVTVNYANFLVERPLPETDGPARAAAEAAHKWAREHPDEVYAEQDAEVRAKVEAEGGFSYAEYMREMPAVEEEAARASLSHMINKCQDWKRAAALYEQALEGKPDSADALCGYAALKKHLGDVPATHELYQKALRADPRHAPANAQYGLVLHKETCFTQAREHYTRALRTDPTDAATTLQLAVLLETLQRPTDEVIAAFKQALTLLPTSADIYHSMGRVLQASAAAHHRHAAEAMFESALELDPRDVSTLNSLGLLMQLQGRNDEAEQRFRRALALAPHQHALHCNFGAFLHQVRQDADAAEEHYSTALSLDPQHLQTLCCYGSFLRTERFCYDEALRLFRRAFALAPDLPAVQKSIAALEMEARRDNAYASGRS